MRFLVDENAGPRVAAWLEAEGHTVFSVADQMRGADDETLLRKAWAEDFIVITADKDFGDKVYLGGLPHKGVMLLRLEDERATNKIEVLRRLLEQYAAQLPGRFVVVSEKQVRFAR